MLYLYYLIILNKKEPLEKQRRYKRKQTSLHHQNSTKRVQEKPEHVPNRSKKPTKVNGQSFPNNFDLDHRKQTNSLFSLWI